MDYNGAAGMGGSGSFTDPHTILLLLLILGLLVVGGIAGNS